MACGPGHTWHHLLTGSRTSRVQSRNVNSSVSDYKAWALNWSRACSSATPPCHHAPLPYSQAYLVFTQLLSIHFPQLQAGATRRHRQPQFQRAPHQSALQLTPFWPCALRLITGFLSWASGLNSRPLSAVAGPSSFKSRCCSYLWSMASALPGDCWKCRTSCPTPVPLNQNLYINKIARWLVCTLRFEKHRSRWWTSRKTNQLPVVRMLAFLRLSSRITGPSDWTPVFPPSPEMIFLKPSLIMHKILDQLLRTAGRAPTGLASLSSFQSSPPTLCSSHGNYLWFPENSTHQKLHFH